MTQTICITPDPLPPARNVNGTPVASAHGELQALLRTRLSARHAALFAQPQPQPGGYGWATEVAGSGQPVSQLDLARRTAVMLDVQGLLSDVRVLAERIIRESPQSRRLSPLLTAIAQEPAADLVWLVGDQPVIVGWTRETPASFAYAGQSPAAVMATSDGQMAVRGDIGVKAVPAAAPPVQLVAAVPPLRWASPAALLLGLLLPLLLLAGLGWAVFGPSPYVRFGPDTERIAALTDQLNRLTAIPPKPCDIPQGQ